MNVKTLKDLTKQDLENKKVLVRVDFNVPINKDGVIVDDSRIVAALPTIEYLVSNNAKVILVSHMGRPEGQVVDSLRLDPVAHHLARLVADAKIGATVTKLHEATGDKVRNEINRMAAGDICLLENIRFYPGEEKNDSDFAKELASIAEIFVNDAFGAAHRAHASTVGVTAYLNPSVAGLLMAKEVEMLGTKLANPERPFTAIIGGAKVSSKIMVLKSLLKEVDTLLIGGAMAYTFLKAQGCSIGMSLYEEDYLDTAREIMALADETGAALILPEDNICTQAKDEQANPINFFEKYNSQDQFETKVFGSKTIDANWQGLDIGQATADHFAKLVSQSRTIVWNGPLGVFEYDALENGTKTVAKALIELTQKGGTTIVGGGDSVAALEKFGMAKTDFSHVSTGGGASLEFLEGKVLPGIACLDRVKAEV